MSDARTRRDVDCRLNIESAEDHWLVQAIIRVGAAALPHVSRPEPQWRPNSALLHDGARREGFKHEVLR